MVLKDYSDIEYEEGRKRNLREYAKKKDIEIDE